MQGPGGLDLATQLTEREATLVLRQGERQLDCHVLALMLCPEVTHVTSAHKPLTSASHMAPTQFWGEGLGQEIWGNK